MGFFSKNKENEFHWENLTSFTDFHAFLEKSNEIPIVFFKHSTHCSISSMAKSKFERQWNPAFNAIPVYLDLIQFREISNLIAATLHIEHQSPQAILLINNEVKYTASHNGISVEEISKFL